jgi:hypothetical protein
MEANQMKTLFISYSVGYVFATFINWQFDPSEWSEFGRFAFILFGFTLAGMVEASKKNK